jgi:hypothetical protein
MGSTCTFLPNYNSSDYDLDRISTTCGLTAAQVVVLIFLGEHGEGIKHCRSAEDLTVRLFDGIVLVLSPKSQSHIWLEAIHVTCKRLTQTGRLCSPIVARA